MTILVVEMHSRTLAEVLVLELGEDYQDGCFRASVGQTTDWYFDPRDSEWDLLERLM